MIGILIVVLINPLLVCLINMIFKLEKLFSFFEPGVVMVNLIFCHGYYKKEKNDEIK